MPRQATRRRLPALVAAAGLAALCAAPATAAEGEAALRAELEALKRRISELERRLEARRQSERQTEEKLAELEKEVASAAEWKSPNTLIHMAGYADVGYTDERSKSGTFDSVRFNPIVHYQYRDLVMLESELELKVTEDGETETGLEYATIDLFPNDYLTIVAGKFLSPVGWFRQNLHPSWINRLPSAPAGFGHDQAAPNADVGLQVRGGFPAFGGFNRVTYAVYVGNGPTLEADGGEIEMIETPGLASDADGKKVVGGRLGVFLAQRRLELGVSGATGKVSVTKNAGASVSDGARGYRVLGADFTWRPWRLDLRGEYVRQEVDDLASSAYATEGGTWRAWYLQAAYRFRPTPWEVVARYADYDTPHDSKDLTQWALGVNYVFAANIVAKLAYEFNDNPNSGVTPSTDDRMLVQMAYGF